MAYTAAGLPLTGAGDATANVGVDRIGTVDYQMVKMLDGTEGSTIVFMARETTPGSTDAGLVVRPIGSTAHLQGIAGTVTVGNPTTAVTVTNPTTAVTVSNPTTAVDLSSGGSTRSVGTVNQGSAAGSSADAWWVRTVTTGSAGGSTAVDLSSGGSTKLVGTVGVSSGVVLGGSTAFTGMITSGAQTIGTVELSSAGSTRTVGVMSQGSPAASSAEAWWVRTVTTGSAGGSTVVDANNTSAGSTKVIGLVDGIPMARTRSSRDTSVDTTALVANAARRAALIQNGSTGTALLVNLSTVVVTSIAYDFQIPANGFIVIGGQLGNVPLYTGGIHMKMNSTVVAGPAYVSEFT